MILKSQTRPMLMPQPTKPAPTMTWAEMAKAEGHRPARFVSSYNAGQRSKLFYERRDKITQALRKIGKGQRSDIARAARLTVGQIEHYLRLMARDGDVVVKERVGYTFIYALPAEATP